MTSPGKEPDFTSRGGKNQNTEIGDLKRRISELEQKPAPVAAKPP